MKNEKQEVKNKTEVKKESDTKKANPSKSILIAGAIILVLVLLGFYISSVNKEKNLKKLSESYLLKSGTVSLEFKNLDEINPILSESPNEYFVLISYTKDEDTYNLEVGLKNIIDKYKLNDKFYYLNVESIMNEDNYINRINNAFNTDKIKKVPTILYYKDGSILDVVERYDNNPINASDFQKLLDIYGYVG